MLTQIPITDPNRPIVGKLLKASPQYPKVRTGALLTVNIYKFKIGVGYQCWTNGDIFHKSFQTVDELNELFDFS